jgi:UDP-glucose 4-epimerase
MKALIVGASGFIGKNLAVSLPKTSDAFGTFNRNRDFPDFVAQQGLDVRPVQLDLSSRRDVKAKLKRLGPFDVCIYLAADNNAHEMIEHPSLDVENNVLTLINFLDFFRGRKLVYVSSGSVYTGLIGRVTPKVGVDPTLSFTIGRFSCERYVKFYSLIKRHFQQFMIVRFFGSYGRFESQRKITPRLIGELSRSKDGTFTIFGDGKNYIDLMHVSDAVDALLKIAMSKRTNMELDLCSGNHQTLNEYARSVARVLGCSIHLRHEGRSLEYIRFYGTTRPLEKLFGFIPKIGLAEGIRKYAHELYPQRF